MWKIQTYTATREQQEGKTTASRGITLFSSAVLVITMSEATNSQICVHQNKLSWDREL